MAIGLDFTIAQNGDIRYVGTAHGTDTAGYYTVIEFHRWLQDLADDAVASASSSDFLDITDFTPSERQTDNIIQLVNGYNIDQTASEHLFDGSIIQNGGVNIQSLVDAVWNAELTGATYNIPTSAGRILRQIASNIITDGMVVSATVNTVTLNGDSSNFANAYDPAMITIVAGTGYGETRGILEYNSTTHTVVVDRNWVVVPDNTSEYIITGWSGREHVNEGLARGVGTVPNSIILNERASDFDDAYKGQIVFIRSGTGQDQACKINSYNGTTKEAITTNEWNVAPDTTSGYVILPSGMFSDTYIAKAVWNAQTSSFVENNSFGAFIQKKILTVAKFL